VGRALIGKRKGDDITVPLPDNTFEFEVLKVVTIHESLGIQDSPSS
jgi:transcription elongation GreA/GreB family factor